MEKVPQSKHGDVDIAHHTPAFRLPCDKLTVFDFIDALNPAPSAHGSPLGSVLKHRNSSGGLGLIEKHLSRAGVRLDLSDGRRRGHICTTGETFYNARKQLMPDYTHCIAFTQFCSVFTPLYPAMAKLLNKSRTQCLATKMLVSAITNCECVSLERSIRKHTGRDQNELSGFGADRIGSRAVVVAEVALRLWIDLWQIK